MEERSDFEIFKSNICHKLKEKGDLMFLKNMLESGEVIKLFEKNWHRECFYLLAMIDYLSKENGISLYEGYDPLRTGKMEEIIYPAETIMLCYLKKSDKLKKQALKEAIPEFLKYNIVETDIRNVY
jgi:hypothetical protein